MSPAATTVIHSGTTIGQTGSNKRRQAGPDRTSEVKELELSAPTEPVAPLLGEPAIKAKVPDRPADATGESDLARSAKAARRPWENPTALLQWAVLAVPILVAAFQGWTRRWSTEDAFITFRVVDQLLSGNGPNFNVGERVEAATSPLWMYLLGLFKVIFGFVPLPWIAVTGGFLLTLAGLLLAMLAARRLERARGHGGFLVPVGMLVFCCVQPVWDFTTSGLETGLVFAWLAGAFYALTTRLRDHEGGADRLSPLRPYWAPVLIGLGPLVRPDLAVATVIFLLAYLFASRRDWRLIAESTAVALALPVLYQLFRMGYYGAIVPNTAIAKEAGLTQWDRGFNYLTDLVGPYLLLVPAVLVGLLYAVRSEGPSRLMGASKDESARDSDRQASLDRAVITLAPLVSGAILGLFVVKVGGDFMHGRLLLPALFCLLMPIASIAVERSRVAVVQGVILVLIAVWCVAGLFTLGPQYDGRHLARGELPPINAEGVRQPLFDTNTGIGDERSFWETFAGRQNPISLDDYQASAAYQEGLAHRERAEQGLAYLWVTRFDRQRTLIVEPQVGIVTSLGNIGVFGYNAGSAVWVEDWAGLSDPVGARIALVQTPDGTYVRGRPGHEKLLPEYYSIARWTQPSAGESPDIQRARQLLACGDVAELMHATNDPMTPARFFSNLANSPKFSSMRIPISPTLAVGQYCQG